MCAYTYRMEDKKTNGMIALRQSQQMADFWIMQQQHIFKSSNPDTPLPAAMEGAKVQQGHARSMPHAHTCTRRTQAHDIVYLHAHTVRCW